MKIYLVGGAVRDELLGIIPKEKDYVIIGATVEDMLKQGFQQVGKDFPVFLHPQTKEEYALARKERKTGRGYKGFSFDTSPDVTLEEDLLRRDLTINAMAKDLETGEIIDPYGGQNDLNNKILRHVSPAFQEDPVRILRIARFASRYALLGFHIAPETLELMKKMVAAGEVDALVAERVWKELERALAEKNPDVFFKVLKECHAFNILFPTIRQDGLSALEAEFNADTQVKFAILMHSNSEEDLKLLAERYRIPVDYKELALLVIKHLVNYKRAEQLNAIEMVEFLQSIDAFRRRMRFDKFLLVCRLITKQDFSRFLCSCLEAANDIDVKPFIAEGYSNTQLAAKIKESRVKAILKIIM